MKKTVSLLLLLLLTAGLVACGASPAPDTEEDFDPAGGYYDVNSERAMMSVLDRGDGSYLMVVHWGSSAMTYTEWQMNATPDGEGHLTYADGMETEVTASDDGEEEVNVVALDGVGYFTCRDGKLLWDGAENESCRDCEFVREEDVAFE